MIRRLAPSPVADAALAVADEARTRLEFQSGAAAFMVDYPTIWPAARRDAPDVFADLGYARYPAVGAGRRAGRRSAASTSASARTRRHPDLAFEAAACLRGAANQNSAAVAGGLPPALDAVYDCPRVAPGFPFGDLLRRSIADAAPRPATPAYSDVSLAVLQVLHPPAGVDPDTAVPRLRRTIDDALASRALL